MQRFAMGKLVDWKNSTKRKPLVIMGARQTLVPRLPLLRIYYIVISM